MSPSEHNPIYLGTNTQHFKLKTCICNINMSMVLFLSSDAPCFRVVLVVVVVAVVVVAAGVVGVVVVGVVVGVVLLVLVEVVVGGVVGGRVLQSTKFIGCLVFDAFSVFDVPKYRQKYPSLSRKHTL